MRKIKGLIVVIIAIAFLAVAIIVMASFPEGLQAMQNMVDEIGGDRFHIDLTDFGIWSKEVKDNALTKLPVGDAFFDVNEGTMNFFDGYEIYTEDVSLDYEEKDIKNVKLMIGACDVKQNASEDKKIHVSSKKVGRMQCFQKGDTLYILAEQKVKEGIDLSPDKGQIELKFPKEIKLDELNIELGAGQIEFAEAFSKNAKFEVGAGNLKLQKLKADNASFEVGMGQVHVTEGKIKEASVNVDVGNFIYGGSIKKKAKVECSVGNAKLTLSGKEKQFNYSLECSMGNITLGDQSYTGLSHSKEIDHSAKKDMQLECSMGNIKVEFEE